MGKPNSQRSAAIPWKMAALLLLSLGVGFSPAASQRVLTTKSQTVKLYPNGAPGSEKRRSEPEKAESYWVKNIHDPSLRVFHPNPGRANRTSVIIMPGGGHQLLVYTNEGIEAAEALSRMGITAFVLKYRLAREPGSPYSIEDAAADADRAVRYVRAHAAEYAIDPQRIGVMGFSAGGELASIIANYPREYPRAPKDALASVSSRPNFQVLVFPGPGALAGEIRSDAPPAFLVAGSRDACCGAATLETYTRLFKAGASAELHMYADAGHAFNINQTDRISVLNWTDRLFEWLFDSGLLRK